MKKLVWIILAALLALACNNPTSSPTGSSGNGNGRPTIKLLTTTADQALRFYGTAPASTGARETSTVPSFGFSKVASAAYRPQAVFIGPPLIEPRGMVKGKRFLYISDSGKDNKHKEPATIWRIDPVSKKLEVFYRGPLLTSSKWLWFLAGRDGGTDKIIVSDFGEEPTFHGEGNGVGAKVFTIDVKPDGSAGETHVIFSGPPLRDPQGVTVIGNTIILADTRAGEPTHRADAPGVQFRNGVVFALPLSGGAPTRLFPDQTFVTLVGACTYYEGHDQYLRVWDIDGGRRDTSRLAWMPHSGFSALKRARVESAIPLKLGPLENVPFVEEFPIEMQAGLTAGQTMVVTGSDETTLSGVRNSMTLRAADQVGDKMPIIAESPTTRPSVVLDVKIVDEQGGIVDSKHFEIPKNVANPIAPLRDNKHAGARVATDEGDWLDTTVDGLSKTVSLFPKRGGLTANVWQGAPLMAPMASQPSWDDKKIWITDLDAGPGGTGAVWQVPMPQPAERTRMYARGNAWMMNRINRQ